MSKGVPMKTFSSLVLIAAVGALSATAIDAVAAPVDTSKWKCESCPFEEPATSGAVEAGAGYVSDDSQKFGNYTGLEDQGGFLMLGGELHYRGEDGTYASLEGADLGLDVRSVEAEGGRDGLFGVRVGYDEIPHWLSDGAATPFLGVGGGNLTLPGGYPQPTTAAMPLVATLRPVNVGFDRKRLDGEASLVINSAWSTRLDARHEVRDGTRRAAGSFFSTASQLAAPVDDVTDQIEAAVSYAGRRLQGTLSYLGSLFSNDTKSLTWGNPFTPLVPGADAGQLALAPDNEFHQVMATLAYEFMPQLMASGEIAVGRMTQNDSFLPATINPDLEPTVPALPATSLDGEVDTFNASVRVTATPTDQLRLNASYARDEHDNQTDSLLYPAVSTDMFLDPTPNANQPFSFTLNRYKFDASYRGPLGLIFSAGLDQDNVSRTRQEVSTTRDRSLWGQVAARPLDYVTVELKLEHGDQDHSNYGVAEWINPPENPLLRKFNLANRSRDQVSLRTDLALGERWNIGVEVGFSDDDYSGSAIGLTSGNSVSTAGDVSLALTDDTQAHAFVEFERVKTHQAGSQVYADPDWWGKVRDEFDVVGVGISHLALDGKLELTADVDYAHSNSNTTVDNGAGGPSFPANRTEREDVRLQGVYHLRDNLSLVGSYWYEHYNSADWAYSRVQPDTVPNLLAFGEQSPHYAVQVVSLAARYRF